MSIETDLKKDGIHVIKPLDSLSVTLIAKFIAEKFISYFPFAHMRYDDLFIKISKLNMYVADIPSGMSEANYLFRNESIYFKSGLSMTEMKELAVHEFIHHYQEKKDSKNVLYRLGLCDFTSLTPKGMAMNEAAVQLLASNILKKPEEEVKYYGINFSTVSPNYYPLLCNLINQMAYITGYDVLVDSTLRANDKFKNCFTKLCGKKTYNELEKSFDKIIKCEESIMISNQYMQHCELNKNQRIKYASNIEKCKDMIKDTYIKAQNLILTSYFNSAINNLYSVQDIEDYRVKLYTFKDYIGVVDNYTYFNEYYINLMSKLDEVYSRITNTGIAEYKRSIGEIAVSKFTKIFGGSMETENVYKY